MNKHSVEKTVESHISCCELQENKKVNQDIYINTASGIYLSKKYLLMTWVSQDKYSKTFIIYILTKWCQVKFP